MFRRISIAVLLALPLRAAEPAPEQPTLIIVTGAAGEESFGSSFAVWAANWRSAGGATGAQMTMITPEDKDARESVRKAVEGTIKESTAPLWVVLLGHGSFDGREGKFNLPGNDLSASDLVAWLKPLQRPVVVVCGFSASGAFLKPLAAPNRIVITATRSGAENNYARFAGYLADTITAPSADIDKDGQTSLLEAWLAAGQRTAEFYKNDDRLATEHALLDDNSDGFGTPTDWFQGIRVVKKSSDQRAPDGLRAHQVHLVPSLAERALSPERRAQRDTIERELAQLRETKASMPEQEFYAKLETLLLQLARIYRESPGAAAKGQ